MSNDRSIRRVGCALGDHLIVLDLITSRYFSLRQGSPALSSIPPPPDHRAEILSWSDDHIPSRDSARVAWVTRPRSMSGGYRTSASPATLVRLWQEERRTVRALQGGIVSGLAPLQATPCGAHDAGKQQMLIAAGWHSRRLWSAEDRCLPRSIALTRLLRRAGSNAKLVIGVMANPFAAHAWVQDGEVALNDTLDHVLLFAPIFVA